MKAVAAAMPEPYSFEKRSRHSTNDLFNAVLNYLYGMTYTIVEGGIFAAGLDPYLGFIHVDEHKKPTLTFDVIEPFRPWLDRLLIEECLKGNLQKDTVLIIQLNKNQVQDAIVIGKGTFSKDEITDNINSLIF